MRSFGFLNCPSGTEKFLYLGRYLRKIGKPEYQISNNPVSGRASSRILHTSNTGGIGIEHRCRHP